MATAILKEIFQIELIRTRDEKILDQLEIVYDVGGGELDHHGIKKVYREDGVPYAACGLIWRKFGREVLHLKKPELNNEEVDSVFAYIDRTLIEGIDALDNGVRISGGEIPLMNITSIISGFNPPWLSEKSEDEAFREAVEVASAALKNKISHRFAVLNATENVVRAYEKRVIPEILVLDSYCPYAEALRTIDEIEKVLFVVYPRKNDYELMTVRGNSGEDRKMLPEAWAGKRNEELAAVTGVEDAIFCHTGRFIAVAGSFDSIMKMAQIAVSEPEKQTRGRFFEFIAGLFSRR